MVQFQTSGRTSAARAGASSPVKHLVADAARQLVAAGAIMTQSAPDNGQHLVGHFDWLGSRRVFWFTAYGETLGDGHVLDFDAAHLVENVGLCFTRGAGVRSLLSPIEHARVDDPDDYRIAWQLWQEVEPLRRPLILACRAELLRAADCEAVDALDGLPGLRPLERLRSPGRRA